MHEAHLAFAAERAWIIETVAIFAEGVVVGALVDVLAVVAVAPEASVADTLEQLRIKRSNYK